MRILTLMLAAALMAVPGFAQTPGIAGASVSGLAVDPRNPAIPFAGTADGIYKSNDRGATWASVRAEVNVFSIAIDPSNSAVYAAAAPPGGLLKTTDGGTTWTIVGAGILGQANVITVDADSTTST